MLTTPTKLIAGIRFNRNWTITDNFGALADKLVKLEEEKKVPVDSFQKIGWANNKAGMRLHNEDDSINLQIDHFNIVFTVEDWMVDQFKQSLRSIMDVILPMSQEGNILNRIGIMYEFDISDTGDVNRWVRKKLTKLPPTANDMPNGFYLRTAYKTYEEQSRKDRRKGNFYNTILTIDIRPPSEREDEKEEDSSDHSALVTVDSQKYFQPEVPFDFSLVEQQFSCLQNTLKTDTALKLLSHDG